MVRALTSGFITAATASVNRPIFLYEGIFSNLQLRLWSGTGILTWNSVGWNGNGWLQGWQGIEEADDLSSTGMEIILAGVPQELISAIFSGAMQGGSGKLWIGFLNDSGAVIADPYLAFAGRLDVPTINYKVDGATVQIAYESKLVELDRAKEYRYTSESQHIFAPNDKGFDFVPSVQKWKGQWGKIKQTKEKKKNPRTRYRRMRDSE